MSTRGNPSDITACQYSTKGLTVITINFESCLLRTSVKNDLSAFVVIKFSVAFSMCFQNSSIIFIHLLNAALPAGVRNDLQILIY